MERKKKIIQSYVYADNGKCFFVSTINRTYDIPAAGGEVNGEETIAWEYDEVTKERGEMVWTGGGMKDHWYICQVLERNGKLSR